jgi:hypothetical protein
MDDEDNIISKEEKLSNSQKKLLELLGHSPQLTDKEYSKLVGYRYYNYVSTVKNKILKKRGYLKGPNHKININLLFNNKVNRLMFIILFPKNITYDQLINIIKNIKCWSFIYPLEENTFNQLLVTIYNTNKNKLIKIFEYLKNKKIIFFYTVFELEGELEVSNPIFFKNKKILPYVPNSIKIKDYEETKYRNININKLSLIDTRLIMHLQSNAKPSLPNYMKSDAKIVDKEGNRPYLFGYNSWRYSYEKLINNHIIEKYYTIYPLPKDKCAHFFLFLTTNEDELTKNIGKSIGNNCSILKASSIVKSLNPTDYGTFYYCVHCRCHPLFRDKILGLLDNLPHDIQKNKYNIHNTNMTDNRIDNYYYQSISLEEEFFDFKKQIVSYSYDNYYKIIKNEVSNLNRL